MLMIFYEMKTDYNIVLLYGLRITRDVYRSMDKSKKKNDQNVNSGYLWALGL